MKLIRAVFMIFILGVTLNASEKININFKDLKIMDLVKITSKIIDKNILVTQQIKGNVDFISNKPLEKDELVKILIYVLESKGYTLVQNNEILRIVKLNEGFKNNAPILNTKKKDPYYQMVTEVFPVHNANVDYIISRVRHLSSKTSKMVSNKNSNAIVMTDFKDNVETVKKVIAIMTSGAQKSTEVVVLKNIKALEAKKSLDAIAKSKFNTKIETEKVSVIANKDNNSIVIIGKSQNIRYLKKYIVNVDNTDSLVKRIVEVIPLKNVEAKNVIKIIDGIIGKKKYLDADSKPLSSIDEESNSIVLMGPANEIEYVKVILKELDKEKAQVYVQARVIELNETLKDEIGVKYGIFGGTAGTHGLATFASGLNGGDAILTNTNLSLSIPNISTGLALGASISLLDENGAADIVSEPSILAIDNKESSIYVGETISIQTGSSTTDGGTVNNSFKREDVGLTLKVKPRVSNDNKVTLEINTILEDVKTTATTSGNPDTTKKEVKTTAIVNNGESVIIGGLIEDKDEKTDSDIPGFSKLPLIGGLFEHDSSTIRKRSLVIVVTPYIVPKSKDLTYVRNQLAELKLLEDRFLKSSLIRLKEKQLKKIKEENEYELKLEALERELEKANNSSSSTISSNKSQKEVDNRTAHEKRVAEIMGN